MSRSVAVSLAIAACLLAAACIHRSPVVRHTSATGPLTDAQSELRDALARDIDHLATTIGPRHAASSLAAVQTAEAWITTRLRDAGLVPQREAIDLGSTTVANVAVTFPGTTRADEILLLGAHYDTVPGSPGADDNATGVALLLATAERLAVAPAAARTVRVVFFVNEEAPFTGGVQMGSRIHADAALERGDRIVLMLNLDSVGYYLHDKGSQRYPPLVRSLFPSTGNFVVFATDKAHRSQVDRVVALFQQQSRFPTIGVATDSGQMNRGDHAPFLWRGYPAVAVTDTSEFRNPNYHRASDVFSTLDLDSLARMGEGWVALVRALAEGEAVDEVR